MSVKPSVNDLNAPFDPSFETEMNSMKRSPIAFAEPPLPQASHL